MATENFYINAEDGWTLIAQDTVFLRVSSYPVRHDYFLAHTSSGAPSTGSRASGTITISGGVPLANDTVTVNGTVFTFKSSVSASTDVLIGADANATGNSLAAAINAVLSAVVYAVNSSGVVTVTSVSDGIGGNAITLAENATNTVVSGATLTGGVNAEIGIYMDGCEFFCNVALSGNVYARAGTSNPDKALRLDVFKLAAP